jgi:predicted solute-binding protein
MLHLLLRKRRINADFIQSNFTSVRQLLQEAPYALVIGDEALACNNYGQKIFDLGEEWWSITQQPAVFAVSAIRSNLLERSDIADRIIDLVRESLEYGYANLGQIIEHTATRCGLQPGLLAEYFVHLRLDYTARVARGYEYLVNMLDSNSRDL